MKKIFDFLIDSVGILIESIAPIKIIGRGYAYYIFTKDRDNFTDEILIGEKCGTKYYRAVNFISGGSILPQYRWRELPKNHRVLDNGLYYFEMRLYYSHEIRDIELSQIKNEKKTDYEN